MLSAPPNRGESVVGRERVAVDSAVLGIFDEGKGAREEEM
jgi:hypothetical protein